MRKRSGLFLWSGVFLCGILFFPVAATAQHENDPGRSVGKVSIKGDLIVMELDDGVLGKTNLFDLMAARCVLRRRVPVTA